MRKLTTILLALVTAITLSSGAQALPGGPGGGHGPGPGPGPGGKPTPPRPNTPPPGPGPGGAHPPGPGGPADLFKRLDKDGDGKISAAEAAAAGKLASKIMAADADGDGFVTPDELRQYEQAQAFKRLDKNGDGFLDAKEAPRLVKAADTDGDGKVSQQEFDDFTAKAAAAAQAHQAALAAWRAADANNDGKLEASEWPTNAAASFASVDANGDGVVTPREVGEYIKANGKSPF